MKPKIGIIITPDKIESISIISGGKEAYKFLAFLEEEISNFERGFIAKLQEKRARQVKQPKRIA